MTRSGYHDDHEDHWSLIRWRGAVKSSLKGKRGQAFLRELVEALDALPVKELVPDSLQNECGVCALGAVGVHRGMAMDALDPENMEAVCGAFGIADAMAREIVWLNDEAGYYGQTPAARWLRVRQWAESWLEKATP